MNDLLVSEMSAWMGMGLFKRRAGGWTDGRIFKARKAWHGMAWRALITKHNQPEGWVVFYK